jgi:hypothetical protein
VREGKEASANNLFQRKPEKRTADSSRAEVFTLTDALLTHSSTISKYPILIEMLLSLFTHLPAVSPRKHIIHSLVDDR